MAKKSDRKAAVAVRELKHPWLVPLLACIYFIVTCMMFHGENKLITLLLILSSIVCVVVRNGVLSRRLTLPALLLGLYVLLDGISTLYAPSGKFALYEFLKVASAACMALLLTGCEPERDAPYAGRCAAVVLEVSGALASLFSIDMVSTRWLYNGLCGLIQALGVPFGNEALQGQRLRTIFENPNVFAGAAGIALVLSLGLAASAASKKERCLHLSCLLITCTAFILAVSRGAMGAGGGSVPGVPAPQPRPAARHGLYPHGGNAAPDAAGVLLHLYHRLRRVDAAPLAAAGDAAVRRRPLRAGHLRGPPPGG